MSGLKFLIMQLHDTVLGLWLLNSLQETYEAKRNEFLGELQKKEEEMRQMFVMRVKEKEAELKEAEKEVSHLSLHPGQARTRQAFVLL